MKAILLLAFVFPIALTSNRRCSTGDVHVREGEEPRIIKSGGTKEGVQVLVRPDEGFDGISLEVEGPDGIPHKYWLPVGNECFLPDKNDWYRLWAWGSEGNLGSDTLTYQVGLCERICEIGSIQLNMMNTNLTLIGHVPSRWIKDEPWPCSYRHWDKPTNVKTSTCQVMKGPTKIDTTTTTTPTTTTTTTTPTTTTTTTSPTTTTTTPTTTTTTSTTTTTTPTTTTTIPTTNTIATIIYITLVSMVAVVAVVLVVICRWKSKRTERISGPPEAVQPGCEMNVTHDDLYDSCDNYATAKGKASGYTEINLYESVDDIHTTSRHAPYSTGNVTYNDLYESVDNYTTTKGEASDYTESNVQRV